MIAAMSSPEASTQIRPATPYERLGGGDVVGAICERFYDLIEGDPAYAAVRVTHGADLGRIRTALRGFLTAWLGGPRDYFANGGPCMMSIHRRLSISEEAARQWAAAMARAIADQPGMDGEIGPAMAAALGDMAGSMVNDRRG